MPLAIDRIDHVVINCRHAEVTVAWYERVLGMTREVFGNERSIALKFGQPKLNVRPTGATNWPTGAVDAPGSLDLCSITRAAPDETQAELRACGVAVVEGPAAKAGALGLMISIYCRDPDGNLVEIAFYPPR